MAKVVSVSVGIGEDIGWILAPVRHFFALSVITLDARLPLGKGLEGSPCKHGGRMANRVARMLGRMDLCRNRAQCLQGREICDDHVCTDVYD